MQSSNNYVFVLYELIGDGLLPTFSRCVREPAVNVAGTEVIVTLLVIILVLAVVAGFLGYQWRLQGGRVSSWASRDEFVSRVYIQRQTFLQLLLSKLLEMTRPMNVDR